MSSKELPSDLPKSLDFADLPESVRNPVINSVTEEIYDPWQGKSHTVTRSSTSRTPISLTSPGALAAAAAGVPVSSMSPDPSTDKNQDTDSLGDSTISTTPTPAPASGDEESILADDSLSAQEKSNRLQKILFASASDGDTNSVRQILGGPAKEFIDIDAKDDSGSTALIYASCFGNEDLVVELLRYVESVDEPDRC